MPNDWRLARPIGARHGWYQLLFLIAVVAAAAFSGYPLASVQLARADNGLTVSKSSDGNPMIGGSIVYTIRVSNEAFPATSTNPDGKATNLDIVDTLPVGATFVSASPAGAGTPKTTQVGQQQQLTFTNVADVARDGFYALTINASIAAVTTPGTTLTNSASARVSNDPRVAASIAAGSGSVTNTAIPFKLTKTTVQSTADGQATGGCPSQVNGAGRGFTYTLRAENNTLNASDNVVVTDTLPAGVEYCGTSSGDGSPSVTPNGDGSTTLVYDLGTLGPGQVVEISPSVAIPYRFPGLGPVIPDGTTFTNTADMTGDYQGVSYDTGPKTSTVTAKYATLDKSSTPSSVAYGDTVNYTLTAFTSADYNVSNTFIVDTIPNGQEYDSGSARIGGAAFPPTDGAQTAGIVSPCAGSHPSAGVYVCNDGTTVLTWGPLNNSAQTPLNANNQFSLTFTTTVDSRYLHNASSAGPILAGDGFTNGARMVYDAQSIPSLVPSNSLAAGAASSSSSQSVPIPSGFSKSIVAVTRGDGSPPPATDGAEGGPNGPRVAVGDIITFRLAYAGSSDADQLNIQLTDILPLTYRYVPGSSRYSGSYTGTVNNANQSSNPDALCGTGCPAGAVLGWLLTGTGNNHIMPRNQNITVTFQVQVTAGNLNEVATNYGKITGDTTPGIQYAGRSQLDLTTLAPNLVLTKSNSSTGAVQGNSIVTYTLSIQNTGTSTAYRVADLTDAVPPDLKFVAAGAITPANAATFGSYAPTANGFGGTLTFTNLADIPPGGVTSISYTAQVQPLPVNATQDVNTATIASYSSQPVGVAVAATFPPISASSTVIIGGALLSKSSVVHQPRVNGPSGPLTIGDRIDYTIVNIKPAQLTFVDTSLFECLPAGFRYIPGSYSASTDVPLPGPGTLPTTDTSPGFILSAGRGDCPANRDLIEIQLGTQQVSAQPVTITGHLSVSITGLDRNNTAVFTSIDAAGNLPQPNVLRRTSGGVQLGPDVSLDSPRVFIPRLTLAKLVARPPGAVAGGTDVDFLVTIRNTGTSPAYDISPIVDTLDPGLTFVNAFQSDASCQTTTPVPGVSAAGQVITIPVTSNPVANGSSYFVCVRATLVAGASPATQYFNHATIGVGPGNKYFTAPSSYPDRAGMTQTQQVDAPVVTRPLQTTKVEVSGRPSPDGRAAPGEVVTYQLTFTIPSGTTLYQPVIRDTFDFSAANAALGPPTDTTSGAPTLTCTNGVSGAYSFAVVSGHATWTFAGNLSAGVLPPVCTLQLDARLLNIPANTLGRLVSNTFTVNYNTSAGAPAPIVTSPNAVLTVVEPALSVNKSVLSGSAATGTATFHIVIANPAGSSKSTAYGISLTDTLPTGLALVSNTSPPPPSGVVNPVFTTAPGSIGLTIDSMAAGTTYAFDVVAHGNGTVGPGTALVNPVTVTSSDLPAAINGNTNQSDPTSRRTYSATSSAAATAPPATFTKTAAPSTITIGNNVDFTLNITVPAGEALYGVTVTDTLPAGLVLRAPGITFGTNPGNGCGAASPSGGGFTPPPQQTPPLSLGTLVNTTTAACVYPVNVAAVSDKTVPSAGSGSETVTNVSALTFSSTSGGTTQQLTVSAPVTIQAPILSFVKTSAVTNSAPALSAPAVSAPMTSTPTATATPTTTPTTVAQDSEPDDLSVASARLRPAMLPLDQAVTTTPTPTTPPTPTATTTSTAAPTPSATPVASNTPSTTTPTPTNGTSTPSPTAGTPTATPSPTGGTQTSSTATPSPTGSATATLATSTPSPTSGAVTATPTGTTTVTPLLSLFAVVGPGNTITYTLSYANTGPVAASGVVITDTYAAPSVSVVPGSISDSGTLVGTNQITWNIGTIAAGGSGSQSFTVTVITVPGTGVIPNVASLDANELPKPLHGAAVDGTSDLRVVKSVSPTGIVEAGDTLTYTLTLTNPSPATSPATGVLLHDPIPAHTTYVPGSASDGGSLSGTEVTWPTFDVPVDATITRTFKVKVVSPLTNGTIVSDRASYTWSALPPGNDTDTNLVVNPVHSAPQLHLDKTTALPGVPIGVDGIVEYTLVVSNTGNENANNVVVTDPVPFGSIFVGATHGGSLASENTPPSVVWQVGTLAVGDSQTLGMTVRAPADPTTGQVPANLTLTNQGNFSFNNDAGHNSGTGLSQQIVRHTVSHQLEKSSVPVSGSEVSPGAQITYTLLYTNTGSDTIATAVLADPVPEHSSFVSASDGGALHLGVVEWNLGSIQAQQTVVRSYVVQVDPPPLASGTLIVNVSGAAGLAPNPVPLASAVLAADSTRAPWLTSPLDTDDLSIASASVPRPLNIAAQAAPGIVGTLPNVVSNQVVHIVSSSPVFSVTKLVEPTTPVTAGAQLTYHLRVRNNGTEDATNVTVDDVIPDGTTYVDGSASGGQSVTLSGRTLTWTIASLPVGGLRPLSYDVIVNTPLPSSNDVPIDIRNQALVTGSSETDPSEPDVPSNVVVNSTIGLTIEKSAAPASGGPVSYGGTIEYAVKYTNVGSLTLTNAQVVDDVPQGTTFVSAANGGVFSAGGANGRGTLTWIVPSLAAGASSTVTYRVVVDNPTTPPDITILNSAVVQPTEVAQPAQSNRTLHFAVPPPPSSTPTPLPTSTPTPAPNPNCCPGPAPTADLRTPTPGATASPMPNGTLTPGPATPGTPVPGTPTPSTPVPGTPTPGAAQSVTPTPTAPPTPTPTPAEIDVAGVVVDAATGAPVPEAQVDVIDAAGDVVTTIPLNSAGGFELKDVAPGTYTLRVTTPCTGSTYDVTVEVPAQTYVVLPVDCPASPAQVPPAQVPPVQVPPALVP
jgi:uncharacterized repeat protein (TIGR01451 family)